MFSSDCIGVRACVHKEVAHHAMVCVGACVFCLSLRARVVFSLPELALRCMTGLLGSLLRIGGCRESCGEVLSYIGIGVKVCDHNAHALHDMVSCGGYVLCTSLCNWDFRVDAKYHDLDSGDCLCACIGGVFGWKSPVGSCVIRHNSLAHCVGKGHVGVSRVAK
eukprot:6469916-Amphidinium_carterae.1